MNPARPRCLAIATLVTAFAVAGATAETLDTLVEYGNANRNYTGTLDGGPPFTESIAGIPIGADFSGAASGSYTITAGGEDFWNTSDHGSFIYDADGSRAAGENFSAIVRSVSIGAGEILAPEWGRTGIMARANPTDPASANVAHIRKTGGDPAGTNPADTLIQGRPSAGAGTDRGPGENGEFRNFEENTLNGSVDNTPIWLGLHRFDGRWFASWAPDDGGNPGPWSDVIERAGSAEMSGEVWVGLAHQSHRDAHPEINTAVFEDFEVGAFDPELGNFPPLPHAEIAFDGTSVLLTAYATEIATTTPRLDVDWTVQFIGPEGYGPGVRADIYMTANSTANRDNMVADTLGEPDGSTIIPNMSWSGSSNATGGTGAYPDPDPAVNNLPGPNLFSLAVPGSFTGNQENYGVHLTGEMFIPSDSDRDGVEFVRFHDGVDDFTYLEVDGFQLINDNSWTSWEGTGNNGGAQATLDVSDPKFDDGEWVAFRAGMWEGGGGDHCNFTWDALDRTGEDTKTGATDDFLFSYNPTDLPDGNQVNFSNDPSDQIPWQNLRVPQPSIQVEESGSGQPDSQLLTNMLRDDTVELQVFINGNPVLTVPTQPFLASAGFTGNEEATLVIGDVGSGGTRDVDVDSLAITRDGFTIAPMVSKNGTLTTIVDAFPAELHTVYQYEITGTTTAATGALPFSFSATLTSWPIREVLRAGLDEAPNASIGWDVMEFDVVAALGTNLGGGAQGFRDAQDVIRDGDPIDQDVQPFINHTDPDTNAASGDWVPDLPILSDDEFVDDNQYVTYARTVLTIADGEQGIYTFRIRGDDGYGLRVRGATFLSVAGNANNTINPDEPTSVFFPEFTGDSNAFAVCEFPAPGNYPVEFFGFEGGGGSYQEIAWTPGAVTALNQSSAWQLVGNTDTYLAESLWGELPPEAIPPLPAGVDEEGWSIRVWYNASVGTLANTMNWVRTADPAAATAAFVPSLNHSDDGADAGQFNPTDPFPGDPNEGSDTNDIGMIAHARIIAPVDGDYTLQVRSDDGFLLRWLDPNDLFHTMNGGGTLHPSALNEAFFPAGTGDSNTRVSAFLTAGPHDIVFVWWEGGGGSHFEISAAPGVVPNAGNPPFELLGTTPSATNLYLGKDAGAPLRITDIAYDRTAQEFTLTWNSRPGASYSLFWGTDLLGFPADIDDSIESQGETTTYGPFDHPNPAEPRMYFRVQENN